METKQSIDNYISSLKTLNPKYLTSHIFYPNERVLDISQLPESMKNELFHSLVLTCKDVTHVFHTNKLMRKLVQIYISLLVDSRDIIHTNGLEKYACMQFTEFENDLEHTKNQKIRLLQQFDQEILQMLNLPETDAIKSKLVEKSIYKCSTGILAVFLRSDMYKSYFSNKILKYIANRHYMVRNINFYKLFEWFPKKFIPFVSSAFTKNSNI